MSLQTVHVPHLGGIDAACYMPHAYDPKKPTVVLVNSLLATHELYQRQYSNEALTSVANLLAIEPLGHGKTRARVGNYTYWDSAIMNLQVLDALNIPKAFVLGTSQGGWITVRMALLAPEKVVGLIPLGTSMDCESQRSIDLGCWNAAPIGTALINEWTTNDTVADFLMAEPYANMLIDFGLGKECDKSVRDFWLKAVQESYKGDDGRQRARMASINLRDRDGLHGRLFDVRCPVLWMHGTSDVVYSVANAQEEIKMFVNSPDAQLKVVEGGQHFLSATHPEEVDKEVIEFIKRYS